MTFFCTRINVGDYEAWKPMFDADTPGARAEATGHRIFRNVDDPGEVFLLLEFASVDDAREGRARFLRSGVLDRFDDRAGPTLVEESDAVAY